MRWKSRIRFLFLMPAVVWVLAFTVFPLVYSLAIAFYKIEQKVEVKRTKEPVLNEQGQPVLDSQGQPRTRNVVQRDQVTTWSWIGGANFQRLVTDPQVREAIKVSLVFVLFAVHNILGYFIALVLGVVVGAAAVIAAKTLFPANNEDLATV